MLPLSRWLTDQTLLDNHRVSRFTASDVCNRDYIFLCSRLIPNDSQRELLAVKVLDIGKDILKSAATTKHGDADPSGPQESTMSDADVGQRSVTAVKWLQHALQIMERTPESHDNDGDELAANPSDGMSRSHLIKAS